MNFKHFFVFAIVLLALAGNNEARPDIWQKIGKELEGAGQRTLAATQKVLPVAREAAEVLTLFKSAGFGR